ncbi:MAG: deoxynucleoside kinase [Candidatus Calescibacterium sp.]|nr:deoxynucleoside kinase [Candidatus Calescibacterium sp.]MDW8132069.1 deoxynucleoside kinase [Candidatus Calescibacterium sp.]
MGFSIISIEGADGTGKSTIADLLYHKMVNEFPYLNIEKYHEPMFFKDEIYNTNINDSKYLFLLFLIARKKLIKLIDNGQNKIVIMDRYIDSTFVYQALFQRVIDFDSLIYFHGQIVFENNSYLWPDITFILEADFEDIKKRIKKKNNSKLFDRLQLDYIQSLYKILPIIFSNRIFYFFNTSCLTEEDVVQNMFDIVCRKILRCRLESY